MNETVEKVFAGCDVRTVETYGDDPEAAKHFRARSDWGPGEWSDEPDKVEWVDAATKLPCLIVRNRFGALCGYVGVPPGNPAHGKRDGDVDVDVHGGLTFSNRCNESGKICHDPKPGEEPDVWWLGFDCSHAGDLTPGMDALDRRNQWPELRAPWFTGYKDIAYVKDQVEKLARQLKELA